MNGTETVSSMVKNKDLRIFNLIWAAIFLAIGFLPLIGGREIREWSVVVFAVFISIAVIYPKASIPFYRLWIKFGGFIGRVNSKIILGIIFFFIITPAGLILKALGKDILNKRIDKKRKSYWQDRTAQPESMRNQF